MQGGNVCPCQAEACRPELRSVRQLIRNLVFATIVLCPLLADKITSLKPGALAALCPHSGRELPNLAENF